MIFFPPDSSHLINSASEFHQPEVWTESVKRTANAVKRSKLLYATKQKKVINRVELPYVPGFQGRTGDVKNNESAQG